jgi:hypothetical protein
MTQGLTRRRTRWRCMSLFVTAACAVALTPVLAAPTLKELDPVPMVTVPGGPFLMGSENPKGRADEWPQRSVHVDTFAIDQVEVTNERYMTFVATTGHRSPPNPYGTGVLVSAKGDRAAAGRAGHVVRRQGLLCVGQETTAHRSGVGEGRARYRWPDVPLGQRDPESDPGELRSGVGRRQDVARRRFVVRRRVAVRDQRYVRQRAGMGAGLVRPLTITRMLPTRTRRDPTRGSSGLFVEDRGTAPSRISPRRHGGAEDSRCRHMAPVSGVSGVERQRNKP